MNKVFIVQPINPKGVDVLKKEVELVHGSKFDVETILKEAVDCEGMLVRTAELPGDLIRKLPKLKVIGRHGVGVDTIDVKTCTEQGVLVVNAPESNLDSVAEHTLGMLLALAKNFVRMDRETRKGNFEARNKITGTEVKGKTVGIVGTGKIGTILAKRLKALEMRILAYDPYVKPAQVEPYGIELLDSLDKVLSQSDFVTVHVPLVEGTRGLMGAKQFGMMKKSAYFINCSRGPVIDEKALCDALKNGNLRGAAVDVFVEEPPAANHPFFELDNILLSPHNAALTDQATINMAVMAAEGILDHLNGRRPKWIVNPAVLEPGAKRR